MLGSSLRSWMMVSAILMALATPGARAQTVLGVRGDEVRACPPPPLPRGPTYRGYDDAMARALNRMTDLVNGADSFASTATHREYRELVQAYNAANEKGMVAFPDQHTALMAIFDAQRRSLQSPSFKDWMYNRPDYKSFYRWRYDVALGAFRRMAEDGMYPIKVEAVTALLQHVQRTYDAEPFSAAGQTAMVLEPILREQLARLK